MGESQSRSVMLHHQDQNLDSVPGGTRTRTSSCLQNQDPNFNFLPGEPESGWTVKRGRGGDENQNLALARDPPSPTSPGFHLSSGVTSPRSRLPCWSTLEPLPEVESGEDGYGRVPPDGAEEQRMEDEEGGTMMMRGGAKHRKEDGAQVLDDEWGDSDSESESSGRSGASVSPINVESGGVEPLMRGWDRVGVGEPKPSQEEADPTGTSSREATGTQRGRTPKQDMTLTGSGVERNHENQSSDSEGELPELMDAVWTLRDRERFKAQEMEKHQVQLTMYRRLALIRWVRTLQGRVQEQQNRLQSSFDVILTHRKELLRMGAAAAAVSQS